MSVASTHRRSYFASGDKIFVTGGETKSRTVERVQSDLGSEVLVQQSFFHGGSKQVSV